MTINLEDDLVEGNIVEQWLGTNRTYKYYGKVELIHRLSKCDPHTFIFEGTLFGFQCWKVKEVDSDFTTARKVYFRISDSISDIPEKYISQYTYNLEYESKEYLRDNFGESFGNGDDSEVGESFEDDSNPIF